MADDFQGGAAALPPPLFAVPEDTTQGAQQQAEGVGDVEAPGTVEFLGERFRLAENVSPMALAKFADKARAGTDTDDMEALASMYRVIRSVIARPPLFEPDKIERDGVLVENPRAGERLRDPDTGKLLRDEREWHRFEELADDECADEEQLMGVVQQAIEVISARPTKRRADSSATSPPTSERSRASSSSPATSRVMDGMSPVAQLGR